MRVLLRGSSAKLSVDEMRMLEVYLDWLGLIGHSRVASGVEVFGVPVLISWRPPLLEVVRVWWQKRRLKDFGY
jgi:hypothetical protein